MDEVFDFDLDFLGQQNPTESDDNFDMRQLAQRIAETDGLVRTVKSLEDENRVLKQKLVDLNQSANEVQLMYSKEYAKGNELDAKNVELSDRLKAAQLKIGTLEAEITQKSLYYDQIAEEGKRNAEEEKCRHDQLEKRYKELCEKFMQQAKVLSDKGMLDIGTKKDITEMKRYLHKNNIEFTVFTSPKKRDSNSISRMVSRGTQYTTSTTTRSACTSAFIKKHNVGTNFPEVVPISIEDIFLETLIDLPSPIEAICDTPTFMNSVGTQTKSESPKTAATIGTCTDLCNVQKEIDFISNQQLGGLVKRETFIDRTDGKSHPQLSDLWSLLGQTIFALIGDGSSSSISFANLEDLSQQMALFKNRLKKNENISAMDLRDGQNSSENSVTKIEANTSTCSSPLPGESSAPNIPLSTKTGTISTELETSTTSVYSDNNYFECLKDNSNSESLDLNDSLRKNKNSNELHKDLISGKMIENSSYADSDLIDFTKQMEVLGKKLVLISPIRDPAPNKNSLVNETFPQIHPINNNEQETGQVAGNGFSCGKELIKYNSLESSSEDKKIVIDIEAPIINSSMKIHFSSETDTINLNKLVEPMPRKRLRMEKYRNSADSDTINVIDARIAMSENQSLIVPVATASSWHNNENSEKLFLISDASFEVNCEPKSFDVSLNHAEGEIFKNFKPETDFIELSKCISTTGPHHKKLLEPSFADLSAIQEEQKYTFETSLIKFNEFSEQFNSNIDSAKDIKITNYKHSTQSYNGLKYAEKQIEANCIAKKNMSLISEDHVTKCLKKKSQRMRKRLRKQQNQNVTLEDNSKTEENNPIFDTNALDDEVLLKKVKFSFSFPDLIEPIPELSTKQLKEFYSNNKNDEFSDEEDFHGFTKDEIECNSTENRVCFDFSPSSPNMQNELFDSYNTIEIPLERSPEYDSDYSPASPRREMLSTEIHNPIVIPLNRVGYKIATTRNKLPKSILGLYIAKYDNHKRKLCIQKSRPESIVEAKLLWMLRKIIERYLMSTANKIECETCARRLVKRTAHHRPLIMKALLEIVEDTNEDISDSFKPPATIMTESHQKILILVKKLNQYVEGFERRLLFTLDQQLFNSKSDNLRRDCIINLTILYISLIDTLNLNKNSARLFIYKCLYYYNKMCIPMIYYVLAAYPGILPNKNDLDYDKSDPLISTIQSILNSERYDMQSVDLKHREVFHMLQLFYNYERVKPSREDVIDNLLLKIRAEKFRNVNYCLALLCKRGGVQWCLQYVINDRLVPMLREYSNYLLETDIHDQKVACLLDCISCSLKPLPAASDISNYQQIFASILYKTDRKVVQESSVAAIFRTSRFNHKECFNLIYRWNPSYKISNYVRLMILSFIHRFTLKNLMNLENQI